MSRQPHGTKVQVLPISGPSNVWVDATVVDLLSAQFTARIKRGEAVQFFNYADEGMTWREVL